MSQKPQKPLHEGNFRGIAKDGILKPATGSTEKPKSPPPAPKPKKK